MPFDEDPTYEKEQYQCDRCEDGLVEFNIDTGCWECDSCDFASNGDDNGT